MRKPSFAVLAIAAVVSLSCKSSDTKASSGPYDAVPVSTHVKVTGLKGPVDVVRDTYGTIHIHATSMEDALRVEGYQVARDRTAQLELIRRSATGRLAEVFGDAVPTLIDSDIAIRTVGLARTAKRMVDQASPQIKAWLDAYADGITQFNARVVTGDEPLPPGMIGFSQQAFQPWTAVDVVACARFQSFNLGYDADSEIALSALAAAAREKLKPDALDPNLAKRAGMLVDLVRFAPTEPVTPLHGFPNDPGQTMSKGSPQTAPAARALRPFTASREALAATQAWRDALAAVRKLAGDKKIGTTGSNNWVVGPSRTASGHALLASDPHLTLSAPSVFWMVQITVDSANVDEQANFSGLSFPGIPGIILGFNDHVAWGATTADYDVTDVYEETLSQDGSGVVFKGATVPFEKVHETIQIASRAPLEYDVLVVPHHGPIVPTITADHGVAPPSGKAFSVKWTGHQPSNELASVFGLLKAKTVDDARKSLQDFGVGAQNWVVADTAGNIFYSAHALIPKRDKAAYTWDPKTFTGTIPCMALPGDGTAEWTGQFLEDAFIPHVKNPAKGYLATANTEQVGTTLDNDPTNDVLPSGEPMYMACWHDPGHRLARIQSRIEGIGHPMNLDDMAGIQSDARSALGAKLTPAILSALAHAAEESQAPGTHKDLTTLVTSDRYKNANLTEVTDLLQKWGSESDFDAASGMSADDNTPIADAKEANASRATSLVNAWAVAMYGLVFDDEAALGVDVGTAMDRRFVLMTLMLADPKSLATYDAVSGDSILFDDSRTVEIESRDERIVHAMLDAIDFLRTRLGPDSAQWRWGRLHTLRFTALVSLWKSLSIPQDPDPVFPLGFPRHGDGYNVDVGGYPLPSKLDDTASFSYAHGPTQRLVIEMDPNGPIARNALPGGEVWDSQDAHFRDEAERWRRNQNRPVPFAVKDVVGAAETRIVYDAN